MRKGNKHGLILVGNSEKGAHALSEFGNLICLLRLIFNKGHVYLCTCAMCSELPTYISTMKTSNILQEGNQARLEKKIRITKCKYYTIIDI